MGAGLCSEGTLSFRSLLSAQLLWQTTFKQETLRSQSILLSVAKSLSVYLITPACSPQGLSYTVHAVHETLIRLHSKIVVAFPFLVEKY